MMVATTGREAKSLSKLKVLLGLIIRDEEMMIKWLPLISQNNKIYLSRRDYIIT